MNAFAWQITEIVTLFLLTAQELLNGFLEFPCIV